VSIRFEFGLELNLNLLKNWNDFRQAFSKTCTNVPNILLCESLLHFNNLDNRGKDPTYNNSSQGVEILFI